MAESEPGEDRVFPSNPYLFADSQAEIDVYGAEPSLRRVKELAGYQLRANDHTVGIVKDFLFDDAAGICRYFEIASSDVTADRRLLLSPISVGRPDWASRVFPTVLSADEIADSPLVGSRDSITRRHERALSAYFHWPEYWTYAESRAESVDCDGESDDEVERPRLEALTNLLGVPVQSPNEVLGVLEDCLIDPESWAMRYLVVRGPEWLSNRSFLVATDWFALTSFGERRISVELTREQIATAPAYDECSAISREYEQALIAHYQSKRT